MDCGSPTGAAPGCTGRLLPVTVSVDTPNDSVEWCARECAGRGLALSGVEAAYGCFCGNGSAAAVLPRPAAECCAPCDANGTEGCGDKFRVWVSAASSPRTNKACTGLGPPRDPRDIRLGAVMLASGYLDQPYCAVMPGSGRWVCTVTAAPAAEGGGGEHVSALWSDDAGVRWSAPVQIEPEPLGSRLANAYSMTVVAPAVAPGGGDRVYAIYNLNEHNISHLPGSSTPLARTDMMGVFAMRWSDTGGASWSAERLHVPFRLTSIDRQNDWRGNCTIQWTVDQPKVRDGVVYFAFTKIGKYLLGPPEELWILASPNLLTARDPRAVQWRLLPDGDHGIRAMVPGTNIEEAHAVPLTGAGRPGMYIAGRTTTGFLVASSTSKSDAASGWAATAHAQYFEPLAAPTALRPLGGFGGAASGVKNPRGPITIKRLDRASGARPGQGDYLMLFYNNGAKSYLSRNPYWLAAGVEVAATAGAPPTILWSQPEIAIFNPVDHGDRPGYPDIIDNTTADGEPAVVVTETQKVLARLHRIDPDMVRGLFRQRHGAALPAGPAASFTSADRNRSLPAPAFPALDGTAAAKPRFRGLGLGFGVTLTRSQSGAVFSTAHSPGGPGVALVAGPQPGRLTLELSDGRATFNLSTDAACTAAAASPGVHFVGGFVDGGPNIATLMVDGVLCDGAAVQPFGWGWVPPLGPALRGDRLAVAPGLDGTLHAGYLYTRALSTSELVQMARKLQ